MTKSSAVWSGTNAKCNESSAEEEITNGWPVQEVWEDFTKKLSPKWALMVGVNLKGEWGREDTPGWAGSIKRGFSWSMGKP